MIRAGGVLFAVLGVVVATSAAAKDAPWPSGIYSSVRVSDETGDMGGLELRFFAGSGGPMVETVLCESVYERSYKVPLERTADGFAFSYAEIRDGDPDEHMRVFLRVRGDALLARLTAEGDPATPLWSEDAVLRKRRKPLGLVGVNAARD